MKRNNKPWLTPEQVLVNQAVDAYYEALHVCGAITAFTNLESQEMYLHGWWMSAGMGPASPEIFEYFQDQVDSLDPALAQT